MKIKHILKNNAETVLITNAEVAAYKQAWPKLTNYIKKEGE